MEEDVVPKKSTVTVFIDDDGQGKCAPKVLKVEKKNTKIEWVLVDGRSDESALVPVEGDPADTFDIEVDFNDEANCPVNFKKGGKYKEQGNVVEGQVKDLTGDFTYMITIDPGGRNIPVDPRIVVGGRGGGV